MENPNVFISYSHDSEEHKAWVLKLAINLRSHGVNAILDQWDLRLGGDLRFFMEQGLSQSNLVLCICSESYVQKANGGHGGSGYEAMIMTSALLQNQNLDYIIPIIRNNSLTIKTPTAFGTKLYIDFSSDNDYYVKYAELLERIYNEDQKKKPPLGKNPFSDEVSRQIDIQTKISSVKYYSPAMDGTVEFRFDNNDGKYTIGTGEYVFETKWSRNGNNSIHAYEYVGFNPEFSSFPSYEQIVQFDFSSWVRTIQTGQILIIKNSYHHFAAIKLGKVNSAGHGHPYDKMTFDYHIYTVQ